jgi:hypothetical protein
MFRLVIIVGLAWSSLAIVVASDEPSKPAKKPVPITKDKLIGKWMGGPKNMPMAMEFSKSKVTLTVMGNGMQKATTLEWEYEIDDDGEWVTLSPLKIIQGGLGSARLNSDGTLSLFTVPLPPAIPKPLKDVAFTRVKRSKPKK